MDNLITQLAAVGGTILAAIVAYIGAIIRNKFINSKEKTQNPMLEKVKAALSSDFLLPIFRNVYQTFVKNVKAAGKWTVDEQAQAIDKVFVSVMNLLPKYIINFAKIVFPDHETSIKEALQNFYEANKSKINIDNPQ